MINNVLNFPIISWGAEKHQILFSPLEKLCVLSHISSSTCLPLETITIMVLLIKTLNLFIILPNISFKKNLDKTHNHWQCSGVGSKLKKRLMAMNSYFQVSGGGGVLIKPPPPSPLPPVPTHVHVYRHDERTSTSGNIYLFGSIKTEIFFLSLLSLSLFFTELLFMVYRVQMLKRGLLWEDEGTPCLELFFLFCKV